jgi:hypothetical protein
MAEQLDAEHAVRLLRAKTADLEAQVLARVEAYGPPLRPVDELAADIALLAALLADHIERTASTD